MSDDILRKLANLIRLGKVQAVASKRVQVKIGGLTRPIVWVSTRASKTKSWSPPGIGEQVMVLSPNGDLGAGVAVGGIFCDANDLPHEANADTVLMSFRDGAVLLYCLPPARSNPCRHAAALQYRNAEPPRQRYVTDGELAAIVAAAGQRMRLLVRFAYLTGIRQGDILAMRLTAATADGIAYKDGKTGKNHLIAWSD